MELHSIISACLGFLGALFGVLVAELIKHLFAQRLQKSEFRHQMKMAALEHRLHAHQEAFAMVSKLALAMNDLTSLDERIAAGKEWFSNKCLFLDEESRSAVFGAFQAGSRRSFLLRNRPQDGSSLDERKSFTGAMKSTSDEIQGAFAPIARGVGLPPLYESPASESDAPSKSA